MSPALVRLILAVLALEAGICMAFVADSWAPLRHREESLFRFALTTIRGGGGFVLDAPENPQAVSRLRVVHPLEPGEQVRFLHVGVDDPDRELESFPPSPVDWAGMLTNARNAGYEVAAIEQPLTWESAGELRLRALDTALSQFDISILTVDLRRAPEDQELPDYLKRGAIPLANVRGNPGTLPRVNRVVFPPSATGSPSTHFAFRILESEEDYQHLPALARWEDHLIPAFPIAVAMAQHKISPEEVFIELGRYIRLGNGPIIPIDEYGRLRFTPVAKSANPETEPKHIVRASMIDEIRNLTPDGVPRSAVFSDATDSNPSPWGDPAQLQQLINSIDVLPHPSAPEPLQRLPSWAETSLLIFIAAFAALLLGRSPLRRFLAFLMVIIGTLALLALLLEASQKWTLLAPVLATALAGWILTTRMARYLPQEEGANRE